jgi:hypothetical protein
VWILRLLSESKREAFEVFGHLLKQFTKASTQQPQLGIKKTVAMRFTAAFLAVAGMAQTANAAGSFQSGPFVGATYPGAMAYDPFSGRIYITGATYGGLGATYPLATSYCMVAILSWPDIEFIDQDVFGLDAAPEVCSNLAFRNEAFTVEASAIAIGSTEIGGLFTNDATGTTRQEYGFLLHVGFENGLVGPSMGGTLLQSHPVQYPVAVALQGATTVYVASMVSDEADRSESYADTASQAFPDWIETFKYGSDFQLLIQRFQIGGGFFGGAFTLDWSQNFSEEVVIGGMLVKNDMLLVVGSTFDNGMIVGESQGEDQDGFITKFDTSTGALYQSVRNVGRIGQEMDDYITNICDDPTDHGHVYTVGASRDDKDNLIAMLYKIRVETLTTVWVQNFRSVNLGQNMPATTVALDCTVFGGTVYVAGNAKDGSFMLSSNVQASYGLDDVFVARVNKDDGEVFWTSQIGSAGEERLAAHGGLAVDSNGNALLYGSTTGSLFREKQEAHADIFAVIVDHEDGSIATGEARPDISIEADNASVSDGDVPMEDGNYMPPYVSANNEGKIGLQSGPDAGPSYAGGMTYDASSNTIFITGQTYGQFGANSTEDVSNKGSCFLGMIPLTDLDIREHTIFGTPKNPEACSAIGLASDSGQKTSVIIGTTTKGGLLTEYATADGTQFGFILDVDSSNTIVGGALLLENEVQYPVAVETDSENNEVYVVTMNSDDSLMSHNFEEFANKEFPNLTTGGFLKYGSSFFIAVTKLAIQRDEATLNIQDNMEVQWTVQLDLEDGNGSDFATGVTMAGEEATLIVTGSARESTDTVAMDGFIAKINPEDGSYAEGANAVMFVSSLDGRDDWITGVCNDPDDKDAIYIVGGTMGTLDDAVTRSENDMMVHAYVSKITVSTMSMVWTKQFPITQAANEDAGIGGAVALGCDVLTGEDFMYVGGVIENGATMDYDVNQPTSSGADDIFVTQVNTRNGSIQWLKQVGSDGVDRLARGGGILADKDGNAVVFGDTTGNMYRSRSQESTGLSDIFVMVLDKADGSHEPPGMDDSNADGSDSNDQTTIPEVPWFQRFKLWTWLVIVVHVVLFLLLFLLYWFLKKRNESGRNQRVAPQGSVEAKNTVEDPVVQHPAVATSGGPKETVHSSPPRTDDDVSVASSTTSQTSLSQRL